MRAVGLSTAIAAKGWTYYTTKGWTYYTTIHIVTQALGGILVGQVYISYLINTPTLQFSITPNPRF